MMIYHHLYHYWKYLLINCDAIIKTSGYASVGHHQSLQLNTIIGGGELIRK